MRKSLETPEQGMLLHESIELEIPNFIKIKISKVRLGHIRFVIHNLIGFQQNSNRDLYAKETSVFDIIEFGHWLKTDRKYLIETESGDLIETSRKGMGNSSVMTYLSVILSQLRELGIYIKKSKLTNAFPFKVEKPSIPEDIIEAILETEIEGKNKHVLDALKLILLHGFRYSDLWVLKKGTSIFITDSGDQYFKYNPPKNHKSINNLDGIKVAVHPLAKKIIEYWADKPTRSTWDAIRAPESFFDKNVSPHLKLVESDCINSYFIFENPLIKIPHYLFEPSVKKQVFFEVHKTWCKKIYGENWEEHIDKKDGLLEEVEYKGSSKVFYKTLGYHTFRHVYCSRYLAKGGNVLDLRDNVGHSSIVVTQEYSHTIVEERLNRSKIYF